MNLSIKLKSITKFLSVVILAAIMSCQPDKLGEGNGLVASDLDASFTITQVTDNNNNTYLFTADNDQYITSSWDVTGGDGISVGDTEEVFIPDAGIYNVKHTVTGIGGAANIVTKTLNVEISDPIAGNIVKGGRFDTDDDIAEWTVLNISASGTEWTLADGKATVTGGGWNQKGLYQTVDVIEGLTYKVDMLVSSTSGVQNTWFEVFASSTQPVDGSDYSDGGAIAKFSTWGGCANEPFSGKLSIVGCDFNGEQGIYIAEATETIYLVIKCGGEDLKDGVSIDNVEMRALN
ncbi:hypothetical protein [Seonamhaeicola maritimus]|uniref:PKD domain-containing protein n=1 Tax=Seonamhaeicola maritimus TaxID=2591822 RepID=A0A5C7GLZ1_9FLAO|nr:hypothetical protein [Seonamhaeicola maritimus]TXG39526.1 hypothetical protein FUA22_06550 [Seonamhaeicola maritimus]